MTGEIFKVPQRAGQRGRPPHVTVVGAKQPEQVEPEIVGASVPGEPNIIDKGTQPVIPTEVEVRQHSVEVYEGQDEIRQRKPVEGEPKVRVVTTDTVQWDKVKRGEDE